MGASERQHRGVARPSPYMPSGGVGEGDGRRPDLAPAVETGVGEGRSGRWRRQHGPSRHGHGTCPCVVSYSILITII
jgi:hypothetical protein